MATRNWTAGGANNKATTAGNWDTPPVTGDSVSVGYDSRGIDWDIDSAAVVIVDMTFIGDAGASGNMAVTLSTNTIISGTLTIQSAHATNTVTLATGTKTLTTGPIVLGVRGCLSQTGTNGNVNCTSYTQSGAGSVLTGKVDATFTTSGNFAHTVGTITTTVLNLVMNGDGTTYTGAANLCSFRASGNVTLLTAMTVQSPMK